MGLTPDYENIKRFREAAGLTQDGLAAKSGLSNSVIGQAERGIVKSRTTMEAIARALGKQVKDVTVEGVEAQLTRVLAALVQDPRCRNIVNLLDQLMARTDDRPIVRDHVLRLIASRLEYRLNRHRDPFDRDPYSRSLEGERKRHLKRIIELARDHVYAVTLDEGDYFKEFWYPERRSDEYMAANVHEHRRVKIERVFIMDEAVISGTDAKKAAVLRDIVAYHRDHGLACFVVSKENLPYSWHNHNTSFLVCDGCVSSESYSLLDGGAADGYVAINDWPGVGRLMVLFNDLKDRYIVDRPEFIGAPSGMV